MSKSEISGHVRIKERIPYAGKGPDELVMAIRRILTDHRYAQKIVMEVGVPYILIEELVPEADALDRELSMHDVIRSHPMEEIASDEKKPGLQVLWEMFSVVQEEGFEVNFITVGDKKKFQGWVGVRIPMTKMSFFGIPLRVLAEIPSDVVLVCGARMREADVSDIEFSVKVSIP